MSLLASLFSAIDSKKRELADVVGNPVESLMQKIGDLNDRARTFNELNDAALAERMAGQGVNSPAQAKLAQTLAESYNPMAMTVYHGSPHLFSRFDASKIGTGEGSQMFGRGLYFAETPEVARQYAGMAAKPGLRSANSDIAVLDGIIKMNAKKYTGGDVGQLAQLVKDRPQAFSKPDEMLSRMASYVDNNPPSYLYQVDLPDAKIAQMLDWDKPLSQQTQQIKALANQYGLTDADHLGGDLVSAMGAKRSSGAQAMTQAGIPGIRYLNEQSRGAGYGPSNFVVFPGMEDILRIEQINGMPPGSLFDMIGK